MGTFAGIDFSIWLTLPILALWVWAAIKGRVDFLLGIYFVIIWQTPPRLDLPIIGFASTTWVMLPFLLISAVVHMAQHGLPSIKRSDWKLIFWLCMWAIWIFIVVLAVPIGSTSLKDLVVILALKLALPLILLSIAVSEPKNLRAMALAFIFTTLALMPQTISIVSPSGDTNLFALITQSWWQTAHGWVNYNTIGEVTAASILFTVAMLADPAVRQKWFRRALYIALLILVFYLIWSSSRQYIIGILLIVPVFLGWLARGHARQRATATLLIILVGSIFILMFIFAPDFFRLEGLISDPGSPAFFGGRLLIYSNALNWISQSPIFGNGLLNVYTLSHNLFLDSLVGQGILGLIFLLGFLILILHGTRRTWKGVASNGLDIWRMTALLLFVLGILQSQVSGGVLTANVFFLGGIMIRRLHETWQNAGAKSKQSNLSITTRIGQRIKTMPSRLARDEHAVLNNSNPVGKKAIE